MIAPHHLYPLAEMCVEYDARNVGAFDDCHDALAPLVRYVAAHGITTDQFDLTHARRMAPAVIAAAIAEAAEGRTPDGEHT